MLRHSNIAIVFRTVREDFECDGHRFSKGAFLDFATPPSIASPLAFPEPMTFDTDKQL